MEIGIGLAHDKIVTLFFDLLGLFIYCLYSCPSKLLVLCSVKHH